MEGEDRDAGGDKEYDEVFVEGVALAENGEVQKHDGEELAGFGEDVGDVVDVGEGGVAEGRGERGCYGNEEKGEDDPGGRKDRGYAVGGAIGCEEIDVAGEGGEAGLDGVEEDGVFEFGGCGRGAVWGGEDAFLEDSPGEANDRLTAIEGCVGAPKLLTMMRICQLHKRQVG